MLGQRPESQMRLRTPIQGGDGAGQRTRRVYISIVSGVYPRWGDEWMKETEISTFGDGKRVGNKSITISKEQKRDK